MTSNVARTLAIGGCAFALLALTDAVQAQKVFSGVAVPWFPFSPPQQLPACQHPNQIVSLALNTGTALPVGSVDPIWRVSQDFAAYSTTAIANAWLPNQPSAKWIQPVSGGTPVNFTSSPPVSIYTYTTQFSTPFHPVYYTSMMITGMFAADDIATLTLNNNPATMINCPSTGNGPNICSHNGKAFTINGNQYFAHSTEPYVNTLTIQVNNFYGYYSGLFVKATLNVVCSKCSSPPYC